MEDEVGNLCRFLILRMISLPRKSQKLIPAKLPGYMVYKRSTHVCTKQMLYCLRSSFSGLELHASYDWWAKVPNMHRSLFLICQFMQIPSITRKPQVPASLLHTKWLFYYRGCFVHVKSGKAVATYKLQPCIKIAVYLFCVHTSTNDNKTQGAYYCIMHQTTTFLPRLHLLEVQSEVRLTNCRPAAIAMSLHYM